MTKAVAYLRYSSDKQTEQSIEGQMHVCQDYAQRNKILITGYYIDRAMSAKTDNRHEFQRMLQDSAKRAWDMVLVYKLDRFSRDKFEMAIHRKTLKDNGVKLVSCTENIPDTPEGIILESLLEGMAQYYSAELAQKVHRGMNESRRKGLYTGGPILFGYRVENQRYVINEDEADLLRSFYRRYLNGEPMQTFLDELHENGILCNGHEFRRSAFYRLFSNEKYTGVYRLGDDVFDNVYPRIIPQDLFDEVQELIRKNQYGKHGAEKYLFKGKMICGYCGKPMAAESGTSRNGDVRRYYSCQSRKRGKSCQKELIKKSVIEDLVVQAILEAFGSPELIAKIAERVIKAHEKRKEQNTVLNMLEKEAAQVQKGINNILDAMENGMVSPAIQKRLEKLETRLEELQNRIYIEQANMKLKTTKADVVKYIKKAIAAEPTVLIRLLVKQIVLYDNRVEIEIRYVRHKDEEGPSVTVYETTKQFEVEKHLLHVKPKTEKMKVVIKT